jgi:hypothetical protein
MAGYLSAGTSCYAPVQTLMAQWLIFTENGQTALAAAVETQLNALGAWLRETLGDKFPADARYGDVTGPPWRRVAAGGAGDGAWERNTRNG